jgi:glycosyltransferase involved in cell wall biosynthesis
MRVIRRLYRMLNRASLTLPISFPDVGRKSDGVDILGFFTSEHGVGQAARVLAKTLESVSVPVSTIDYTDTESRREHPYRCDNVSQYKVLLASINSEQLVAAHHRISPDFFRDRYVIGQWFWELEEAPSWFAPAFPLLNELWAPTRFIESMLRSCVPPSVRVVYMPLPVLVPATDASLSRAHFGLDDRYMFLFAFDFMSVMKRKNPLGLVEAFRSAFSDGEGPQLVIKGINGDKRPAELAALCQAVSGRTDITFIDGYFTRIETSTLIGLADCYVSLHRSEGLGLTISEAMSLAVPVIATAYSGNLDFMENTNSKLVPSLKRVPVGFGAEGYSPTATWMEPDLEQAAQYMRLMYKNPQAGSDMGERGRRDVLRTYNVEQCGVIMRNRLDHIWRTLNAN